MNIGYSLLAIGSPAYNDQHNDDLRRLDAKMSCSFSERLHVFAETQKLTDERYGCTFHVGAWANF